MVISEKDYPVDKSFDKPTDSVKYLQDSEVKSQVYERIDVTHGVNCKCCTSIEQSNQFQDEYRKKFAELHKGRNERVRQRQALARAKSRDKLPVISTGASTKPDDDWNPYPILEDLEEK